MVLAGPLLLLITIYAEAPGALSALLLVPSAILLLLSPIENGSPLLSKESGYRLQMGTATRDSVSQCGEHENTGGGIDVSEKDQSLHRDYSVSPIQRLPALTSYRGHMMLVTVLSILAVDFQVFPRALAKCETYGVSLVSAVVLQWATSIRSFI